MRSHVLAAFLALVPVSVPALAWAELSPEQALEVRTIVETGLASAEDQVLSWALRAAALLDDDALFEAVATQLASATPAVRIAAATALLAADQNVREAQPVIVTELATGDASTRSLLLERMLGQLDGDVQVDIVNEAIEAAADNDVFNQIVSFLARRAEGDLYEILMGATEWSPERRTIVANRVGAARRPQGVAVAQEFMDSDDAAVRLQGAEIAMAIDSTEARTALAGLLGDSDAAISQRVGFHLARFGNVDALGAVRALAANTEMPEELRMEALALLRDEAASLYSFAELEALRDEPGRSAAFVTRVHEVMGATQSAEALEYLRGRVDGMFAEERLDGFSGLGYAGDTMLVDSLASTVGSGGEQLLRLRAAEALGNVGGDAAAQALGALLPLERDAAVRLQIVRSLGNTGSSFANQALANELSREDSTIATEVLAGLRKLQAIDMAFQVENAATAFRDPNVRWQATITLAYLDPAAGRIRLLQALSRPPEGFYTDIEPLPQDLRDEIDVALLGHQDTAVREAALFRVLGRTDGGYSVLRAMLEGSAQPEVRREAIALVTSRLLPEDRDILISLTNDTDRSVRMQAWGALADMADPANEAMFADYLDHADLLLRMVGAYGVLRSGVAAE
jgi:hypothetical protein